MNQATEHQAETKNPLTEWLHSQLAQEQFLLAFQPITPLSLDDSVAALYHEAVLRHTNGWLQVNPFFTLERYKAINVFDLSICSTTIATLRKHQTLTLSCNISVLSAVMSDDWNVVCAQLKSAPEIASRLVLEVTETSPVYDIDAALEFFAQMKALGCRIAIDDFGEGFSTLEFARRMKPDIIKVSRGYLQRSRESHSDNLTFSHLLELSRTLAPNVVVEGVDSLPDKMRALDCGARWGQGNLYRTPAKATDELPSPCTVKIFRPRVH